MMGSQMHDETQGSGDPGLLIPASAVEWYREKLPEWRAIPGRKCQEPSFL